METFQMIIMMLNWKTIYKGCSGYYEGDFKQMKVQNTVKEFEL